MKTIILYIMSALLLAAQAFARIGETIKQIEDRYGPPSQTPGHFDRDELGNEFRVYNFRDFRVAVTFENGKSAVELFTHEGRAISDAEINAILGAYGDIWKPQIKALSWMSKDGKLKAGRIGYEIQVGAVAYITERTARIKQNEADRLKGF